jgi:hypothetical protein
MRHETTHLLNTSTHLLNTSTHLLNTSTHLLQTTRPLKNKAGRYRGIQYVTARMLSVTARLPVYLLFLSTYDERGEGTSLRSEVKNVSVTSHQKLRICAKEVKKRGKKSEIEAKMKLNKRSDFLLTVRLWVVYAPFMVHDMPRQRSVTGP